MFFFTLTAASSVIYSCSQLFLAEAQHMEGSGSGVGTVRVGMSSSHYGRGIIHVTGCHEVTPQCVDKNVGRQVLIKAATLISFRHVPKNTMTMRWLGSSMLRRDEALISRTAVGKKSSSNFISLPACLYQCLMARQISSNRLQLVHFL